MTKRGLEISSIELIDMDLHSYFHLEAVRTPLAKTLKKVKYTLINWYLRVLQTRKDMLQSLTDYVIADTYFRYLIKDGRTDGKGRPKLYDGEIHMEHLEEDYFDITH